VKGTFKNRLFFAVADTSRRHVVRSDQHGRGAASSRHGAVSNTRSLASQAPQPRDHWHWSYAHTSGARCI